MSKLISWVKTKVWTIVFAVVCTLLAVMIIPFTGIFVDIIAAILIVVAVKAAIWFEHKSDSKLNS